MLDVNVPTEMPTANPELVCATNPTPVHAIAKLFPPMSEAAFADLVEDIRAHGLREPITLFKGQIVDGVHRERACRDLGIEVATREYDGREEGLVAFVVSANLHRRHLTESQRAMVMEKVVAKGTRRDPKDRVQSATISYEEASRLGNIGATSIKRARVVRQQGVPELAKAVERGNMRVYPAAKLAWKPKAQQRKLITAPLRFEA